MKAYKITGINLRSLTIYSSSGRVQYGINHTTVPNVGCGPLAAFKSLASVNLFKRLNGWKTAPVFECTVERDRKAKNLWFTDLERKVELPTQLLKGTIFCKKIILKERVC